MAQKIKPLVSKPNNQVGSWDLHGRESTFMSSPLTSTCTAVHPQTHTCVYTHTHAHSINIDNRYLQLVHEEKNPVRVEGTLILTVLS